MSSQPVQGAATLAQPLPLENAAGPEIENPNTAQEVALDV